ncbi:jacalin-like lectin [Roseimarinus sediminis]|uniref:jacalin-like lectin n=1 Tax=Roseimarinus sediminis TaxID=1610899 RepID=UPI003D1A4BFB
MKIINPFILIILIFISFSCEKNNLEELENNKNTTSSNLKSTVIAGDFTVLTYNIAGLPELISSGNPAVNTPKISVLVNDYDIVQVQEDFNYHAALYADDYHPYRTATSGGVPFGDGLNTLSNFPFSDDIERIAWDDCSNTDGNCLTPKGFTLNRIRLEEGVYLDVYNFHTGAGDVEAALDARRKNIIQIVNYINANSAGNAVLLTGDSNCRYTRLGDNIRLVASETGATDVWLQMIKDGIAPTQGDDALVCEGSTIITDYECEIVDKIFYRSNNFITLTPLEFTYEDSTFRDENGDMLSDHRPVFTHFQYALNSNLKMSDQFGGPHGTSYNDANNIPANPVVGIVGIRTGSRVDQINIMLSNGTWFTHGGYGGDYHYLSLASGEYLKSVKLCSGQKDGHTRIFYTKFTTSNGRTLAGGSTTDSSVTYTAPDGWQIVGFHGRSGDEIDKMGVIYAPVN